MITFILIFGAVVLAFAAWFVASSAGKRKRSEQAGSAEVASQQEGMGAPGTGRPTGVN